MSRKVTLKLEIELIVVINDGSQPFDVIQEVDYTFDNGEFFDVMDYRILEYEVTNSN